MCCLPASLLVEEDPVTAITQIQPSQQLASAVGFEVVGPSEFSSNREAPKDSGLDFRGLGVRVLGIWGCQLCKPAGHAQVCAKKDLGFRV